MLIRKIMLLAAALLITSCESFFFHPLDILPYQPDICARKPENFYIETKDDLTLHAWLFRTPHPEAKGTVIFMHGNSRNMGTESLGMLWLLDKGYNLFTFDYRGYGISQGKPSIKGIMEDGAEAVDGFMQINSIDKTNIILWGQSLGGAAASYAAANSPHADKIKILVLDSTFTSWREIARDQAASIIFAYPFQYPISAFYPDDKSSKSYLPLSKIKNTLIIHSRDDKLINIKHGETLFKLAKEPKVFFVYDYAEHARIMNNSMNRPKVIDYFNKILFGE